MTATRPPVLRTKLRPPAPGPRWIERARLVDRLRDAREPIWVVAAPAGYGKTTLLARVIGRERLRAAWVSVDSADDAPVRFWSHVAAALGDAGVTTDAAVPALLDGEIDRAIDELVVAIEAVDHEVLLVLDDVHEVGDVRVLAGVERLIARPPAGLRLALIARLDLDLGLARRRSHGAVLDIGAADLAFTSEEGRDALATDVADGVLGAEDATSLVERTGGWPAGVWLALLALRTSSGTGTDDLLGRVSGASPELMQYLGEEVLAGLTSDVRRFLIDTSILEDLTPDACDAVAERSDSLATLRHLAADQVFTALIDADVPTYRTHRLFREFLLAELDTRPAAYRRRLHERAMEWFCETGELDRLVWHAVRADRVEVALESFGARLVEATNRGRVDEMWRWIEWIGAERRLGDPELAAIPAWVAVNQRRYAEIDPWLDAIELVDDVDPAQRRDFDVHAAAIRATRDRHLGLLDRALEHGAEAVRRLETSLDELVVPTVLAIHAQTLALVGDDSSEDASRRAIDAAVRQGQQPPLVMAYAALGLALADRDPTAAGAAADAALALVTSDDLERFHRPAMAWVARSSSALAAGRVADALTAAQHAAAIAEVGDEPAVAVLADLVAARSHHLLGNDEQLRAALRRAEESSARLTGADWIVESVRAARAETRFAPLADRDQLPVGARELSDRERAVLRLLPFGLSRRELADQLFVSENTVKTHLTSIRRKLGLRGRSDIVERARALGLIDT